MTPGRVIFWAWTASLAAHVIVFSVFGITKLSAKPAHATPPVTPATQIKKLIANPPIVPKPRIKTFENLSQKTQNKFVSFQQTSNLALPESENSADRAIKPSENNIEFSTGFQPKKTEFFGSQTDQRTICFLVDCSGSMKGMFGRVKKELKNSIAGLQADQYFCVIFFGNDRLFEFQNGNLVRATKQNFSKACDFIDSIEPAGPTNTLNVLERAMNLRSQQGKAPSVIYFLTDGFEITDKDLPDAVKTISNLQSRLAPETKINTIGFWPQDSDKLLLETIAKQSGGKCTLINDDNF